MTVLCAATVSGQDYPNKPIRLVTAEPGGSPDFVSRVVAQGISGGLGQSVIVDNRPTMFIGELVAKATPDGYTLLVTGSSFWLGPLLRKTPYDVARDFAPVTLAIRSPTIVVVHPSVPVQSVKELIALAKARPGELNYASASIGSANHLGSELFKAMAGVNIVRVPYKGAGPALSALVAGNEVQLSFATLGSSLSYVKAGRLRALAVTSAEPSALLPDLPTVAATVPGYESVTMNGIFAPAKTPAAIINRLNQEMVRALTRAEVKERFINAGVEPVGSSPEQFAAKVKSEAARLGKVIKDAGIRGE